MKLIIAIVNGKDSNEVSNNLTKNGFFVTKLATTGGFLKKGNVTFLIGVSENKVDEVFSIIKEHAKKRVEKMPAVTPGDLSEFISPVMVDVVVGGATVFVMDVDNFEKF